ncbi:MAG TPA: hypothetical protein VK638_21680 [Edaphobacter sp.]|nr:hypothetical protein [Edaphobacter sp.]
MCLGTDNHEPVIDQDESSRDYVLIRDARRTGARESSIPALLVL